MKSNPAPPQTNSAKKQEAKPPTHQPAIVSSQIMLPLNFPANAVNAAAPNLTTVTPQPVIVNNQVFFVLESFWQMMCSENKDLLRVCLCVCVFQGFIVASPQLAGGPGLIASLGSHYPAGTSFAIVPGKSKQNLPLRT